MKIKIVLFLAVATFLTLIISSYKEGPDFYAGYECTGATGTTHGCSGSNNGVTCHSNSTSSNNVTLVLDSAGTVVKSYYPGVTYTVTLSGTNGTGQNLPQFGFQLVAELLAGSGDSSTIIPAGTWDSTAIPSNVHYLQAGPFSCPTCTGYRVPILEHNTQIPATTGTGANGTTYVESFQWSAPASGTGTVVIYGIINAVNGDGTVTGDYNQSSTDTITEAIPTGINALPANLNSFAVYPTLMNDNVTLSFDLKESSAVTVSLISMEGQVVKTLMSQESLGAGAFKRTVDINGIAQGVYLVRLQIGNESAVSKVVKE